MPALTRQCQAIRIPETLGHSRRWVALALAVLLPMGCGDDLPGPDLAADASTERPLGERLLGAWTKPGTYVEFRDDGFLFAGPQASALLAPETVARYSIENETFTHEGDPSCPEPVEVRYTFDGDDAFVAEFVDDPCPDRAAASNGRYVRFQLPPMFNGTSVFDRIIEQGLFIDDIKADGAATYTDCSNCAEVAVNEWERKDNGRYGLNQRIYYDTPPPGGGAPGSLACETNVELFVVEVDGEDVLQFAEVGWILLESSCPFQPPINFRLYMTVTEETDGVPTRLGEWETFKGLEFPGWQGETAGNFAYAYRHCPAAELNEFGYCEPTCASSEQPQSGGSCILPAPE